MSSEKCGIDRHKESSEQLKRDAKIDKNSSNYMRAKLEAYKESKKKLEAEKKSCRKPVFRPGGSYTDLQPIGLNPYQGDLDTISPSRMSSGANIGRASSSRNLSKTPKEFIISRSPSMSNMSKTPSNVRPKTLLMNNSSRKPLTANMSRTPSTTSTITAKTRLANDVAKTYAEEKEPRTSSTTNSVKTLPAINIVKTSSAKKETRARSDEIGDMQRTVQDISMNVCRVECNKEVLEGSVGSDSSRAHTTRKCFNIKDTAHHIEKNPPVVPQLIVRKSSNKSFSCLARSSTSKKENRLTISVESEEVHSQPSSTPMKNGEKFLMRNLLISNILPVVTVGDELADDVFLEDVDSTKDTIDEADVEIFGSVQKNNTAKKIQKKMFPHLVSDSMDSNESGHNEMVISSGVRKEVPKTEGEIIATSRSLDGSNLVSGLTHVDHGNCKVNKVKERSKLSYTSQPENVLSRDTATISSKTPPQTVIDNTKSSKLQDGDMLVTSLSCSSSSNRMNRLSLSEEKPRSSLADLFEDLQFSSLSTKLERKSEELMDNDFYEPSSKISLMDVQETAQAETEPDYGSTSYFRKLLVTETARIYSLCNLWEEKMLCNQELVTEDIQGSIRTTIGQGRLLVAERFAQFSGLVDNCEFGTGEKETTNTDLLGFWEMIHKQVNDVENKFKNLSVVESLGWKEDNVEQMKLVSKNDRRKKKLKTKSVRAISDVRRLIAARRKQLKIKTCTKEESSPSSIIRMNANCPEDSEVCVERTFYGGFFSVVSPVCSSSYRYRPPMVHTPSSSNIKILAGSKPTHTNRQTPPGQTHSVKIMSGLISPFVSAMCKRNMCKNSMDKTASPTVQQIGRAELNIVDTGESLPSSVGGTQNINFSILKEKSVIRENVLNKQEVITDPLQDEVVEGKSVLAWTPNVQGCHIQEKIVLRETPPTAHEARRTNLFQDMDVEWSPNSGFVKQRATAFSRIMTPSPSKSKTRVGKDTDWTASTPHKYKVRVTPEPTLEKSVTLMETVDPFSGSNFSQQEDIKRTLEEQELCNSPQLRKTRVSCFL